MKLELGDDSLGLVLKLTQDQAFYDQIQLRAGKNHPDGIPAGTPIPWPVGTQAWLSIRNKGSQVRMTWPFVVDESLLTISEEVEAVQLVARDATVRMWLHYPEEISPSGAFVWAAGSVVWNA